MATTNLSELTSALKETNSAVTVNVVAEPEKEVIDTIKKGDSEIIKSLSNIANILMQQIAFDKEVENRKRLEEHLKPREFQKEPLSTATREGAGEGGAAGEGGGGILETYGLMRLFGDTLKGLFGLFKRLGGFLAEILGLNALFTALKEGLGSIVGKVLEFARVLGPLALRFGALSTVILGIGEAFKALEKIIENTDWYKKYSEWAGKNLVEGARSIGNAFDGMFQTPGSPETRTGRTIGDTSKPGGGGKIRTWDDAGGSFGLKGPGLATHLQDTSASQLRNEMGISKEQYDVFRGSVAKIESSGTNKGKGTYNIQHGGAGGKFAGAYQMGPAEIRETANRLGVPTPSRKEFAENPQLQERFFDDYTLSHHKFLMKNPKYASMSKEEQLEVLGYAHNQGAGGANKWLNTGRVGRDQFGTAGTSYSSLIKRNLSALEKGDIKVDYSNTKNPITSKEEPSTTTARDSGQPGTSSENIKSNYSQNEYKEALSFLKSRAGKGDDVWNLDADYAVKLSRGMKRAEERFGKTLKVESAMRAPTDKIKADIGSVGSSQDAVRGYKKGKIPGKAGVYGSMHGMGIAADVGFAGRSVFDMNKMSKKDREDWVKIMNEEGLDIPMRPDGTVPNEKTEYWHAEEKGIKRGGAQAYGLTGQAYTDYIKSRSLKNAAEKGAPTRSAVWEKGEKKTSYAKLEKEVPEKRMEEESEMEETNEPILSEKTKFDDQGYDVDRLDKQVSKPIGEEMLKKLDELNSNIANIKDTNKKMADMESAKQSDTATKEEPKEEEPKLSKQDEEAQKTMDDLFSEDTPKRSQEGKLSPEYRKELEEKYKDMDPAERELMIQETEDALNRSLEPGVDRVKSESPGSFKVDIQKPSYSTDQASKENDLIRDKGIFSNTGTNPFGGILKPTGGGIFNTPNPMGTFGQNPFGTIQGVLGTIGSTVSMGQQIGNMGKYGMGGGMMGGIYGAQGAIGGIQGVLGQMGQQSPTLGGLGQVLGSVGSVAGSIEGIKNMGKYGMGGGILGGINAASGVVGAAGNIYNAMGGLGQVLGGMGSSTEKSGGKGFFEGIGDSIGNLFGGNDDKPSISSLGIGEDSASLSKSLMNDGMMLESTTQAVQSGKEELMTPTQSSEPTIINAGGSGSGGGGGGNSQSNPSSAGVMGINIGIRNEEATLLRAQFGSVRIV